MITPRFRWSLFQAKFESFPASVKCGNSIALLVNISMVSVCNCNLPKHYGLTIQAHILLESFYKIPMLVCYQTIVGGEGYKELAEAGNFNYVSQDEIRKDSISLVSKSLSALGSTRLLHMQPRHE
jgi:hypothetical protein